MADSSEFRTFPRVRAGTARGLRASTLEVGDMTLEVVRVEPDAEVPRHGHDTTHLCYVYRGRMLEREGASTRALTPGGLRASPAGDRHEIRAEAGGFSCLVIRLSDDAIEEAGVRRPDARRWLDFGPLSTLGAALLHEVRRGDDASPLSVDLLATELVCAITGPETADAGAPPPWLSGVRARLRDDPRALPTLAELAEEAGVSRAHLARAFRRRTGRTIGAYVRRLRVDRARELLAHTDLALSRVAFEAGFADQSHMNRLVAELLGWTPGGLRRAAREADSRRASTRMEEVPRAPSNGRAS